MVNLWSDTKDEQDGGVAQHEQKNGYVIRSRDVIT